VAKSDNKSIQITDERERDFYIAQRDLVDRAGRIIGPFGCAVYNSLLRHADQDRESWPSLATIADEFGMSKPTVIKAIEQLQEVNIIQIVKRKDRRGNKYRLIDAKQWKLPEPAGTVNVVDRSSHGTVNVVDRSSHGTVNDIDRSAKRTVNVVDPKYIKESLKEKTLSRESDEKNVDYQTAIKNRLAPFDPETRTTIKAFLDNVKDHNKTGRMKDSRYLSLLDQVIEIARSTEKDVFRYALQKATDKEAYSPNYVKVVAEAKKAEAKPPLFVDRGPELDGKKYIVYGGMENHDGKVVKPVSAEYVMKAFKVDPTECFIESARAPLKTKGVDVSQYIHLRPQHNGIYDLQKVLQEGRA